MDKSAIDGWLEPLAEDTTGEDLEYDPTSLELSQAASGRPETQFGAAEPPSWTLTRELSVSLFERTRDLRVAMLWCRANVNLEGLEGLAPGLVLLHGLMDRFWDTLHPRPDPDDGDTFARISALGSLDSLDGLLGDVRNAQIVVDRRLGGLRVRDVEVALERLAPRPDEPNHSPGQIQGMLGEYPPLTERVRVALDESLTALKALQSLMNDRFGTDAAVDVKALRLMLTAVQGVVPSADAAQPEGAADDADEGDAHDADAGGYAGDATDDGDAGGAADAAPPARAPAAARRSGGGMTSIENRKDAVRAIQMVCAYLDRYEPTSPAQLLLRRAERLIDKNFLQLVKDLAPEAVAEIARIMGVDPESLNEDA